jgi:hypothetical protein
MDKQEELSLSEMLNTQRWLLNNNLVPDSVKNQLFFFGSIIHKDVQAVEVKIRPEKKCVDYIIYVPKDILRKIEQYKKLSATKSLFGLWRFRRFLKREGVLDFNAMMNSFVRDFCGLNWTAIVNVADFDAYTDTLGVEGESAAGTSQQPNQPPG